MKTCFLAVGLALVAGAMGFGQTAPAPSAAAERALLDQYCVTRHNDKLKTANFSLHPDPARADDHASQE
jgi:hypothetical protein